MVYDEYVEGKLFDCLTGAICLKQRRDKKMKCLSFTTLRG